MSKLLQEIWDNVGHDTYEDGVRSILEAFESALPELKLGQPRGALLHNTVGYNSAIHEMRKTIEEAINGLDNKN